MVDLVSSEISEISEITKASELFKSVIDKLEISKPLELIKPINEVIKTSSKNIKSSNKEDLSHSWVDNSEKSVSEKGQLNLVKI